MDASSGRGGLLRSPGVTGEDLAAEGFAAVEIPAGLRADFIERAQERQRIEADAGAVVALVHAADALVFHHERFRDVVAGTQLHHEMTATAAAGAGGEDERGNDGRKGTAPVARGNRRWGRPVFYGKKKGGILIPPKGSGFFGGGLDARSRRIGRRFFEGGFRQEGFLLVALVGLLIFFGRNVFGTHDSSPPIKRRTGNQNVRTRPDA